MLTCYREATTSWAVLYVLVPTKENTALQIRATGKRIVLDDISIADPTCGNIDCCHHFTQNP